MNVQERTDNYSQQLVDLDYERAGKIRALAQRMVDLGQDDHGVFQSMLDMTDTEVIRDCAIVYHVYLKRRVEEAEQKNHP